MSEQRLQKKQREQTVQQQEAALHLTKSQILAIGGSLLTTGVVELATHNPEWIAAGILATIAAGKLTPVFMETMMGAFVPVDPDGVLDATERVVHSIPIEDTSDLPQDPISKIKRLLHIPSRPDERAQPKDERRDDLPEEAVPAPSNKQQPKDPLENWIPPQFALDDVLDVVRAFNKKGLVYFGESADGAIAIELADMYHVIDVSSSGKGKSNRFRLAMMQMVKYCETYYINPLAANVKAVKDRREIEVWKPIYDRLANKRPMKEGLEIKQLMTALVEEIKRRNEREEQGDFSWQMEPIFVFIDELPEVFDRCPEAIKMLDKIGRAGRQFSVFCWVASQTANVNEIGQSAAAQANYKTRIYGGGDKTSSERMMKGSLPKDTERTLQSSGAGLTLMLADGIEGLAFVRAPLVTNEALFDYLGIGPFRKEDWIKSRPARLSFSSQRQPSAIASRLRDLRPDEKLTQDPFVARNDTPSQDGQFTLEIEEIDATVARNANDLRPDEKLTQAAQNDAIKYRLTDEQIKLFCALYPNANSNKDECLKLIGANTAYRAHANELIEQYKLLEKKRG